MGGHSIWVGEKRLCLIRVSRFREVAGLGRLPEGRLSGGDIARGARARLLRRGVVIAEDLYVGVVIKEKTFGDDLEAPETVSVLRRCAVAIGYPDVRKGDHIEVYLRMQTAGSEPDLVPGYHVPPGVPEDHLGRAEIRMVTGDPLAGPVAQAYLAEGRMAVGDRVRVVRNGQPVAEALRLLSMTDQSGLQISEAFAGGGASLYLGYPDLRPGDTIVAYSVPAPARTEVRTGLLRAHRVRSNGVAANAEVIPFAKTPAGGQNLEIGFRARVIRDGEIIADGCTIGNLSELNALNRLLGTLDRGRNSSSLEAFEIMIDFPGLRGEDHIEPYQIIPIEQSQTLASKESKKSKEHRAYQRNSGLLVIIGILLFFLGYPAGFYSVVVGLEAQSVYSASRGTGGTAGIVTVTSRQVGGQKDTTCAGSFQPSSGGPPHKQVKVRVKGTCTPGRTAPARLVDPGGTETAYTPGAGVNDWFRWLFRTAVSGLIAIVLVVLFVQRVIRRSKLRNQRRRAGLSNHSK